jgi:hypothetical protein
MNIPSGATWTFDIQVAARSTVNTSGGYKIEGVVVNNGGTTSFVGTPTVTTLGADVLGWSVATVADVANAALAIKVTGAAATTNRWVAVVRTAEVSQ